MKNIILACIIATAAIFSVTGCNSKNETKDCCKETVKADCCKDKGTETTEVPDCCSGK